MERRRFEFVGGKSAKFWEVATEGRKLTVRFGRIGTAGQTKVKAYASEEAAGLEAEKLVREKSGKGYKEVGGAGGSPGSISEPEEEEEEAEEED